MIGSEHPFERYLDTEAAMKQIRQMMNHDGLPFTLDFLDYWEKCEEGALRLAADAYREVPDLRAVLKGRLARVDMPRVVIENLAQHTHLREINHDSIGQLISSTAVVTSIAEPSTILMSAQYVCPDCGWKTIQPIKGQFMPPEPKCETCHISTVLDPMEGKRRTEQWVTVQEVFEETPPNATPINIKTVLGEGLIGATNPGDRIHLVSVVRARRKKPHDPNPDIDLYLEVSSVKSDRENRAEVMLTEEDRAELRKIAALPDYTGMLTRSIAPTLYDLENEKLSLALQQCGGNAVEINGEHKRGSIHVLLAGDPGVGKSKLLEWATDINPRGIKTVGPGSTAAGLTAATIRDEETGRYTLVAGAMVLADGAIVGADEFDKMRKEDRGAIHDAMEEQMVHINKGGFNADLRSRCAILAACNPYGGQWNTSQTLLENIKHFPPALVSRFDLIWVLTNDRTVDEEMLRVRHVLRNRFHAGDSLPPFSPETLRKLFAYAKTIRPRVGPEVEARIMDFYEMVLRAGKKAGSTMMTMRMLEGIARLTEASAKLHLREEATAEDADLVIRLVQESLMQSGVDPSTGRVDASLLETGVSKSLRGRMETYLSELLKIRGMSIDHLVRESDLESALIARGFTAEEVRKVQAVLSRDGTIFYPRPGYVAPTA